MKLQYGKFTSRNHGLGYYEILESNIDAGEEWHKIQLWAVNRDRNTIIKGSKIWAILDSAEEIELDNPIIQY